MKKNVTIYEIAAESGVSVSTVSRVINGNPHVSERTREAVKQVIEKYNFTPSALARAMNNSQTRTLGVVLPDITNPYFSALFLEIERYALERHYSVVLCNTLFGGSSHGVPSPFTESEYFQTMIDKEVDGVIVTGGELDKEDISNEYIRAVNRLNQSFPVVLIAQEIPGCDCLFINRNLGGGIAALIHHLSALGNRRIAFIGGEPGVRQTSVRLEAYRGALQSLELPYEPELVSLSDYYAKDGYTAMKKLLDEGHRPDAAIAINDNVAVGAIRAINDQQLSCPEDIAVASCDQFFDSEYTTPRLTTLEQQNDYLGRLSIMMLLSAINGVREPMNIQHNPRLIIRESCGAQLVSNK